MVVVFVPVPPVPLHEILYVVDVVGVTVTEPVVWLPVANPVPVHDVALVADQVNVDD